MTTSRTGPRLLRSLLPVAQEALGVLSPRDCAGCGAPHVALCEACLDRVRPVVSIEEPPGGPVVVSGLRYEHEVREAVLAFKQRGRVGLAVALAPAFAAAVRRAAAVAGGPVAIVAVPSSRSGRRRRGYDPVVLLARAAGLPVWAGVLVPARGRGPQKSLGRGGRERSVRGSLRCRGRLDGLDVVVVDDVTTTGSTLVEAARVVEGAGGRVVAAACLASTPLRSRRV